MYVDMLLCVCVWAKCVLWRMSNIYYYNDLHSLMFGCFKLVDSIRRWSISCYNKMCLIEKLFDKLMLSIAGKHKQKTKETKRNVKFCNLSLFLYSTTPLSCSMGTYLHAHSHTLKREQHNTLARPSPVATNVAVAQWRNFK